MSVRGLTGSAAMPAAYTKTLGERPVMLPQAKSSPASASVPLRTPATPGRTADSFTAAAPAARRLDLTGTGSTAQVLPLMPNAAPRPTAPVLSLATSAQQVDGVRPKDKGVSYTFTVDLTDLMRKEKMPSAADVLKVANDQFQRRNPGAPALVWTALPSDETVRTFIVTPDEGKTYTMQIPVVGRPPGATGTPRRSAHSTPPWSP